MEKDDEKLLSRRFSELLKASERQNRFTYTDFLGLGEADVFHRAMHGVSSASYTLFGGNDACERKIARFGNAETLGYDEPFPIVCLKISAAAPKFAEKLTHRDYLGALLNLGIERRVLGDIFVSESSAYLFCKDDISDFICTELTRVKHTEVSSAPASEIPSSALPHLNERLVQIASERFDALIASVFNISRDKSHELFTSKRVFSDGRLIENGSKAPIDGAVISVRGQGRFIYDGIVRSTKKGRLSVRIREYK